MNHHRRSAQVWHVFSRVLQFYLQTHTFIRNRNEPYLPLPSQPQLVLIYRPRRDGRLSRPRCEVAQAVIRTRNLPIANPALYQSTTQPLAHIQCTDGIAEYRVVIVIASCLNCTLTGSKRAKNDAIIIINTDDDVDDDEDDDVPPEKVIVQQTKQEFYFQHYQEVFISYLFHSTL